MPYQGYFRIQFSPMANCAGIDGGQAKISLLVEREGRQIVISRYKPEPATTRINGGCPG